MDIELNPQELRVIGSLIEKSITTPDQYPLSLNALTNACNQKSSREPVMALAEAAVLDTLQGLVRKRLVVDKSGFGSRTTKYQHRFCNTEFGSLRFNERELGILCVLMLRGPQTPGELRTRTNRLCSFDDIHAVQAAIDALMQRDDGPFLRQLAREPGTRELRYMHLFGGSPAAGSDAPQPIEPDREPAGVDDQRIDRLEQLVDALQAEIRRLDARIERLESEG